MAPLDTPLQPGATFGGLLDLRPQPGPPGGPQAPAPGPGLPAAPAAGQLLCHQLVILLETEENPYGVVEGAGIVVVWLAPLTSPATASPGGTGCVRCEDGLS
ncbi:hypothetical protein HaLaN_15500, partial [Haematococcus lacustris]